jgi:uncharacterized protein (TIGR02611 family)
MNVKRAGKILIGFTLLAFGAALLVLPGPGWLTIALGLAILAGEYVWAQRLLDRVKAGARKAQEAMRRRGRH